jgi:hypothetical protein
MATYVGCTDPSKVKGGLSESVLADEEVLTDEAAERPSQPGAILDRLKD